MQPIAPASNPVRETALASSLPEAALGNSAPPSAKDIAAPSQAEASDAAARVEKFIKSHGNTQLQFSVDKETNLAVVKVVDRVTHEVLTQIPTKEIIALAQAIDKFQELFSMKGVLLRSKA